MLWQTVLPPSRCSRCCLVTHGVSHVRLWLAFRDGSSFHSFRALPHNYPALRLGLLSQDGAPISDNERNLPNSDPTVHLTVTSRARNPNQSSRASTNAQRPIP